MQLIQGEIDGVEVAILYERDDAPCLLEIRYPRFDITKYNDIFPNARMLSANLATLGYGVACDILHAAAIPYTSALWDLNHSGPPGGR